MNYICQLKEEKEIQVLKIRKQTSAEELPKILAQCYNKIFQYIKEQNIQISGAPYIAYFNMNVKCLDIEVGIPILSELPVYGDIDHHIIPNGKYLSTIHIGPYEKIEAAYKALSKFMSTKNFKTFDVLTAYEFYLNDPSEIESELLETKIMLHLSS